MAVISPDNSQANNGTITLPSVSGGSNQYVVTSTGLNKTADETSNSTLASVTQLSENVSLVLFPTLCVAFP